jgi:hypothetical protein
VDRLTPSTATLNIMKPHRPTPSCHASTGRSWNSSAREPSEPPAAAQQHAWGHWGVRATGALASPGCKGSDERCRAQLPSTRATRTWADLL